MNDTSSDHAIAHIIVDEQERDCAAGIIQVEAGPPLPIPAGSLDSAEKSIHLTVVRHGDTPALGSAFHLGNGWIITCAHVITGTNPDNLNADLSTIELVLPSKKSFAKKCRYCILMDVERQDKFVPDLAMIRVGFQKEYGEDPENYKQWEHDEMIKIDQELAPAIRRIAGSSPSGSSPDSIVFVERLDPVSPKITRVTTKILGIDASDEFLIYSLEQGGIEPGWSGAPVFNQHGEILAVIYEGPRPGYTGPVLAINPTWFLKQSISAIRACETATAYGEFAQQLKVYQPGTSLEADFAASLADFEATRDKYLAEQARLENKNYCIIPPYDAFYIPEAQDTISQKLAEFNANENGNY